jgi:hypothetical protein
MGTEMPDLPGEVFDETERYPDLTEDEPDEEQDCAAYKPWIRVHLPDGTLQPGCRSCPKLGNCMWTTATDKVAI